MSYAIAIAASFAYFYFLQNYYIREYEVPDYFHYYRFSVENLPARDGFSSLFILISSQLIKYYSLIHYLILLGMALALTVFNFGFFRLSKDFVLRCLFIAFNFSLGCWWYFYGKVYYEFPFIALIYSLIFFFSTPFLSGNRVLPIYLSIKINYLKAGIFFFLIGFCLSWKAHAIFPLAGLLGLIFLQNQSDFKKIKPHCIYFGLFFLVGYVAGNFNLVTSFLETIQGIRGYKSGTNPIRFFFDDHFPVWDHVNLFSFSSASLHWIPIIFYLFIAPFFLRRFIGVFILNFLIFLFFIFFIYKFLSGLTWQGFPFLLYIIPLVAYVLTRSEFKKKIRVAIFLLMIAIQVCNNFFFYLPRQVAWFKATDLALNSLEKNSPHILNQVQRLIDENGPKYLINLTTKRLRPGPPAVNALESSQTIGWGSVYSNECRKPCVATYTINIESYEMYAVEGYMRLPLAGGEVFYYSDYLISLGRL